MKFKTIIAILSFEEKNWAQTPKRRFNIFIVAHPQTDNVKRKRKKNKQTCWKKQVS